MPKSNRTIVPTPTFEPLSAAEAESCGDRNVPPTTGDLIDAGMPSAAVPCPTTDVLPAPTATPAGGRLAARIAASRAGTRTRGTPVAGMVPNDEQEAILEAAAERPPVLVVAAGAGTGKTATLKMLEQTLSGFGQYTAFNTSLVAESKSKFVKAACNTTHSLAYRAVGRHYDHRLRSERMRSSRIAHILGIEGMGVVLEGQKDTDGNPKVKHLSEEFLAGQVMVAVRKFCMSADRTIGTDHLRYIDGIDSPTDDGKRGYHNNNLVRDYLVPFCRKAWDDLCKEDGVLPFVHDHYVKIWQLGTSDQRPVISADYILLDEGQDTAEVFLDVLAQQHHAMLIIVGDDNQQIYEWRGAVNAMAAFPGAPRRLLSQSYRFGQAVADVANSILAGLEAPTDLVMRGNPNVPSRVATVAEPRCYLYRTNAGAVTQIMLGVKEGKAPHLIGKCDDIIAWCKAAIDLKAKHGTHHPELACFDTWGEVVEYSKTDEGGEFRLMVKLIETFGAREIVEALKDMPSEKDADFVVSTAHKSKGREWNTVRLGPDFPTTDRMTDPDRKLLYVAATRAKHTLDVSSCPPFCGADVTDESGTRYVPGLTITYTTPSLTEEEQAEILATPVPTMPVPVDVPAAAQAPAPAANSGGTPPITYTSLRIGGWGLRSTVPIKFGDKVEVMTKAGIKKTETVGRVLWTDGKVWLATTKA